MMLVLAPGVTQPAAVPVGDLDFELPDHLAASEPPEARGLSRDGVRLMVSRFHKGPQDRPRPDVIIHDRFTNLPHYLHPGDVLVINTSGTLNAALPASLPGGRQIRLHLSTRLSDDTWVVELRKLTDKGTGPFYEAASGLEVALPAGATATLCAPYAPDGREIMAGKVRLWRAKLAWTSPWQAYLRQHGRPIRYSYVPASWGSDYYQTVYATEPGSAEMPSAGRAFTPEMITRLVAKGVVVAPLTLHTGVSSLEGHESPYPEYFQVPASTARLINAARALGGRIVAVGTTVVRALESSLDNEGNVEAREGWTNLVISRQRKPHLVDGLLTGLHEPGASHLAMLEAIAGCNHLRLTYAEALREQYLWHEFGDLHLMLPF